MARELVSNISEYPVMYTVDALGFDQNILRNATTEPCLVQRPQIPSSIDYSMVNLEIESFASSVSPVLSQDQ